MKGHLTSEQIEAWMIGDRTPEHGAHLRGCPECARALAQAEQPVELFGSAMREWSDRQMPRRTFDPAAHVSHSYGWHPMRIALAGAALLGLIAVPVFRPTPVVESTVPASTAVSDEALLRQVDLEVSRSVPGSMEPLAVLMTNETDSDSAAKQ